MALPADVRDDIASDLGEVFQRHVQSRGLLRARMWYWLEVMTFSRRFLLERIRERVENSVHSSTSSVARRSRVSRIARVTGASILDFKLGLRMLAKHPGLTLAGGLGMAVTIATGATLFHIAHLLLHPPPELDGVVAIEYRNAATARGVKARLSDYVMWTNELESLEHIGAFRSIERNLITDSVGAEPLRGAEVTATGFELMQVPPILGRPIIRDDERPREASVIVLGYDVWRARFFSDTSVVGQSVWLGSDVAEVVGVMPEDFAFPADHDFWVPLKTGVAWSDLAHEPRVDVFGRLTPGVSMSSAQAELTTVGIRQANTHPETHEHLRPRLSPYFTYHIGAIDATGPEVWVPRFFAIIVLLLLSANVGILIYARNATRLGEIGVRSALGASRARIVMQLFVEAFVLAVLAAVAALLLARIAFGQAMTVMSWEFPGRLPFWFDFDLSGGFFLYLLGFTVLASVIVGVLPALRATRGDLRSSLSYVEGSGGMRMGKTWTTLIVCQVAVSVMLLPTATGIVSSAVHLAAARPSFPAEEFGTARLQLDYEPPSDAGAAEVYDMSFRSRVERLRDELRTRLLSEPFVTDVAYAAAEPGWEWNARIDVEGEPSESNSEAGEWGRLNMVEADFFEAFSIPLLEGRRFDTGDSEPDQFTVIVDQSFVRLLIGDLDAIGRRIRLSRGVNAEPGPWHTIVGVVGGFPTEQHESSNTHGTVYISGPPAISFLLLWKGSFSEESVARLREIILAIDPTLRLSDVDSLADVYSTSQSKFAAKLLAWTFGLMMFTVVLLSIAGIYSLTSLAVTMRRREIGIRAALGASARKLLSSAFARAAWQLGLGVGLGGLLAIPIARSINGATLLDDTSGVYAVNVLHLLPWVAVGLVAAGLAGVLGPARRGLSIEPNEALRAD